jgi:hypothetical protein
MEKTCKKCGRTQDISEFYTHKQMADGHLNYCKGCVKDRINEYRRNNIDQIRAYDRLRGRSQKSKELRASYKKKMVEEQPGRYREIRRTSTRKYRESHVKANIAHNIVNNSIKKGLLVKPECCEKCGRAGKLEGHHHDYEKPLEVTWLCPACHAMEHHMPTIMTVSAERKQGGSTWRR